MTPIEELLSPDMPYCVRYAASATGGLPPPSGAVTRLCSVCGSEAERVSTDYGPGWRITCGCQDGVPQ